MSRELVIISSAIVVILIMVGILTIAALAKNGNGESKEHYKKKTLRSLSSVALVFNTMSCLNDHDGQPWILGLTCLGLLYMTCLSAWRITIDT